MTGRPGLTIERAVLPVFVPPVLLGLVLEDRLRAAPKATA